MTLENVIPLNPSSAASLAFRVTVREGETSCVLAVEGELDIATVPALQEAIDAALGSGRRSLVVDLFGLTFIDSSGINVLMQLHRVLLAEGRQLDLLPGTENVQLVFALTGLATALPFVI